MKRLLNPICMTLAFCLPVCSTAQVPATPVPWQSVVDGIALGKSLTLPPPSAAMQPLEYRRKPSQVPLVVAGSDELVGTFCHGSIIATDWLLTAASCVCSSQDKVGGMEVILERETNSVPAKRATIHSSGTVNNIWLFQTSAEATPRNCLGAKPSLPLGITPTNGDLALVRLGTAMADVPTSARATRNGGSDAAAQWDLPVIDMLGTKASPLSILASVAEGALAASRGVWTVESVILAERTASTPSGQTYSVAHPFVQAAGIGFSVNPCTLPETEVARVMTGTTTRACADVSLGGDASALQTVEGTGVALTDHRRPLLLGVRGAHGVYTMLTQHTATTGQTIAQSALDFIDRVDKEADANWFPLHLKPPGSTPTDPCLFNKVGTVDGMDIFQYAVIPGGVAYFYRQRDVWVSVRGAPNSYHPNDVKGALDKIKNAGLPKGPWRDILARRSNAATKPYIQDSEDLAPGFYVSMTKLQDDRRDVYDPMSYVDAAEIPYVVLSKAWTLTQPVSITGNVGDYAAAIAIVKDAGGNDVLMDSNASGAIVADVIDRAPFGGVSLNLARRLNTLGNGRTLSADEGVKPAMDVLIMVFPGTGERKYKQQSAQAIRNEAARYLRQAGGWPALSCLKR